MSALRVVVIRTGGFAGISRRAEVDDPDTAERLSTAIQASADRDADPRARDAFTYEFTVVTTTDEIRVDLPDGALDADLRRWMRSLFH